MKVIQSLWFNKDLSKINYNAGWLDIKYHLMSWALSSLSLKKYINSIELITDSIGHELLIDKLALPYTSVNLLFDKFENPIANKFWALKKIYSYSIHDEPFIFVDGDVFNFNPNLLNGSKLVAQNFERDFTFYHPVQIAITDLLDINSSYLNNTRLDAINTGIIGGEDYTFFKDFKNEIFNFTSINEGSLHKIVNDYGVPAKYVNVWLEQYCIYCYAKYRGKNFSYYLEDKIIVENDYRFLADFTVLPPSNFMHIMHLTKINPTVCEQLAQRLFLESAEMYERVNNVCRQLKSTHHFINNLSISYRSPFARTTYLLEKVSDANIDIKGLESEFIEIQNLIHAISNEKYKTILEDVLNYENTILSFKRNLPEIRSLKENWGKYSLKVNNILLLAESEFLNSLIKRSNHCTIIVSEWKWAEQNEYAGQLENFDFIDNLEVASSYYEVALYVYLHENIVREHLLDALNMLILDAVEEPVSIASVIDAVCDQVVAYQSQMDKCELANTVLSRIRHFLYHGVLEVIE